MEGSNSSQRIITLSLIRKRSEHNEGMVSNLEELALHQEELEAVGPILGRTCGKTLRILLLQNNVISKMSPSDFKQFKALQYLNLALNNIELVEGIQHLEFLNKLDLTLNFIDVDKLEESIENMKKLRNLRELYLMGNSCCVQEGNHTSEEEIDFEETINSDYKRSGWRGYRMFVVASLPKLSTLDGKIISRSERIKATQKLEMLTIELRNLAKSCREYKMNKQRDDALCETVGLDIKESEECTSHTPESRSKVSNEMALQKAEKEKRERANQPKHRGESEFQMEQNKAIEKARERELQGNIKQCNEGKWTYTFNEETKTDMLFLNVCLPKFLSSSLIDVDVHPTYISIVVKSKVLRLLLPAEVKSEESSAQRSTTTGHLLIKMPKINPKENVLGRCNPISTTKSAQCFDDSKLKPMQNNQASPFVLDQSQNARVNTTMGKTTQIGLKAVHSRRKVESFQENNQTNTTKDNVTEDEPPPLF